MNRQLDEVVVGDYRFQAAVSDSINLRLILGCLLTISKVILCQRFSTWFTSCYWAARSASWSCSGTSSSWPVWQDDMAHCHPLNRTDRSTGIELCWYSSTHFSSIPMHLVTLTVPSTMSNFTMSHAAPDHDLQNMLHCQTQALRLEFCRKPIYSHTCGAHTYVSRA